MAETVEAARILGVDRLEFLGYRDSGMMGAPANEDPGCFWAADIDQAAQRLAAILKSEAAGGRRRERSTGPPSRPTDWGRERKGRKLPRALSVDHTRPQQLRGSHV